MSNTGKPGRGWSRRRFLATAAAAVAAPMIIPASALGRAGRPAPSNRITMGCVGVGGQGQGNMHSFLGQDDCQVVAVCDVDAVNRENAKKAVDNRYGNKDCASTNDFRELMARKDIDTISLATPDHWHAIVGIMAAESGKDIFGEKPLTHSLLEGRALCNAVKRYGRIWQTGSWQRSVENFRWGAEMVRNGAIGKVHTVEVGLPTGGPGGRPANGTCPSTLDWEMWVGPAPYIPYSRDMIHFNWRWHLNYGGGQMMDWIGHHADIAHWGMDCDYTGPVEVEGKGEFPTEGLNNAASTYRFTAKYRNGVTMIVANDRGHGIRMGTKWIGTDGWIWVDRGPTDAYPKSLMQDKGGGHKVKLFRSPGHHRNFLDCVKSRRETITPAEVAHRSASVGHLGQIAMLVGRKIRWNPDTEEILNDPMATRLLGNAFREPWRL